MIACDIMTRKVCTISPEASVQEVAQLLYQERISGVPVVDTDGRIIGIVTEAASSDNLHGSLLFVAV